MSKKLKHITGNTYYIDGVVNIGVYVYSDNKCLLQDSGLDETSGRQILKALDGQGLIPGIIINTHSHADHIGGNSIIKEKTNAKIYATHLESSFIENTYLEPFYLYSAEPFKDLKNKFLMAPESKIDGFVNPPTFEFESLKLEVIDLKGHSPSQIGIVTPDNVLFAADSYFSLELLKKHKLPYFIDITNTLDKLQMLEKSDYSYYLPCHGSLSQNPKETIQENIKVITETKELILNHLEKPKTREEIIALVVEKYNIKLNPGQYVLTHSAISAYISYLKDEGLIDFSFSEGKMFFAAL